MVAARREQAKSVHRDWRAMKTFIATSHEVKSRNRLFRLFVLNIERSLSAACLHTMHFDGAVGWKPTCEIDGTFAAKQCRGDKLTGRFVFLQFNVACATVAMFGSRLLADAFVSPKRASGSSAGNGGEIPMRCRALAVASVTRPKLQGDST